MSYIMGLLSVGKFKILESLLPTFHRYSYTFMYIYIFKETYRKNFRYRTQYQQDLRIASICGVFLIILIRYLHYN